ncbi:MAG TPA: response regulator [Spirochaetes bacterium]|nr:response regulator [Spirochaetota bacterium]
MVVTSGRRLFHLINDILDFSKLKHKDIMLEMNPLDLYTLTEVVLSLFKPLIKGKSLKLANSIDPELSPVSADENRVQQIMYNIIGNAIKFTESGIINIEASRRLAPTGEEYVEVSVSDTGIGIPEDKINRVFESFEQVDGSTSREYGGTGIGLTITKQLVEAHGGDIRVESIVGTGSKFIFTLALAHVGAIHELPLQQLLSPPLQQTTDAEELTESTSQESMNAKILVVDDDPVNLEVVINHLSLQKYSVTQALSGADALDLIKENDKFDLVLLDVMMPKMSGYEVCEKIRDNYDLNEVSIIMLTARNRVSDLVSGLDSGANDYMTKPISKAELLARTRTQINLVQLYEKKIRLEKEFTRLTTKIHSSLKNKLDAAQNFLLHFTQSDKTNTDDLIHLEKLISHCSRESKNILFIIANRECTLGTLYEELNLKTELSFYILEISYTIQKNYPDENIIIKPDAVQYILDIYTECLDNIVKHSSAINVDISIDYTDNQLTLSVRDDGVGFNYLKQKEKADSYGLDIFDQLTKNVNGSLNIHSTPGEGTSVKSSVSND